MCSIYKPKKCQTWIFNQNRIAESAEQNANSEATQNLHDCVKIVVLYSGRFNAAPKAAVMPRLNMMSGYTEE